MKTTLDLPDELIRSVKLRAVVQGRNLKDLVAEFLRQGLGMESPGPVKKRSADSMIVIGKDGFPTVRCAPDAPASRMKTKDLLSIEQRTQRDEDAKRVGLPL